VRLIVSQHSPTGFHCGHAWAYELGVLERGRQDVLFRHACHQLALNVDGFEVLLNHDFVARMQFTLIQDLVFLEQSDNIARNELRQCIKPVKNLTYIS
jgi:hypothetical protein